MRTVLSIIIVAFVFTSCIKNNPDPSWIEIGKWELQDNPNSVHETGVLTSNISDAWVYMDGDLLGVFELPVKLPILKDGSHSFKIYPAVLNNGISATKKIYPFLESFDVVLDLVKNETIEIAPKTRYYSAVKFWIEDFEDATFDIQDGPTSPVSIQRVSGSPILDASINEGAFGRISLDATNYFWVGSTIANNGGTLVMNLPKGQEVYLEIDYHNTNQLTTGVLAINSLGIASDNINIRLNSQVDGEIRWKKIYIDLREIVSASVNASYFEFSFQSFLDEGELVGEVNIDNIKAVYF